MNLYWFLSVLKHFLNQRGEGYVETGIKLLISVVIGSLLLTGIYSLFDEIILPTLGERITQMFNYAP